MALKLKPTTSPPVFSFENVDAESSSPPTGTLSNLPSPPTAWLPARDIPVFGAIPLRNASDIGIVICNDCAKPVLRSTAVEHEATCLAIRTGKKGVKAKVDESAKGLKRKAEEPELDNGPKNKKAKTSGTVKNAPKARIKGPVDLDRHCGVINDKGLPCSRSLTCKSHSMGAKRAVEGRSRKYDDLLLDWQRENNPNFVEPVKRETKKERLEKKAAEKRERKRQEMEELARKKGIDINEPGAEAKLEQLKQTSKKKKAPAAATSATSAAVGAGRRVDDPAAENLAELDSEEELDSIAKSLRAAIDRGMLGAPLAQPCDMSSWFVARRERLRNSKDLFAASLMNGPGAKGVPAANSIASVGAVSRMGTAM